MANTRAELETKLTTFFGNAAAWAMSAEPVTSKKGIIPELAAGLEFYNGQGFKIDPDNDQPDQISNPQHFTVVRHKASDKWYFVKGWDGSA